MNEIVPVFSTPNALDAHFLRGLLANEGIDARVVGEHLHPAPPTLPELWVRSCDFERAREIVAKWEESRRLPRPEDRVPPTWKCPTCGSEVDEEMTMCWQCQTPRSEY